MKKIFFDNVDRSISLLKEMANAFGLESIPGDWIWLFSAAKVAQINWPENADEDFEWIFPKASLLEYAEGEKKGYAIIKKENFVISIKNLLIAYAGHEFICPEDRDSRWLSVVKKAREENKITLFAEGITVDLIHPSATEALLKGIIAGNNSKVLRMEREIDLLNLETREIEKLIQSGS